MDMEAAIIKARAAKKILVITKPSIENNVSE
jgi:hypothetical protein